MTTLHPSGSNLIHEGIRIVAFVRDNHACTQMLDQLRGTRDLGNLVGNDGEHTVAEEMSEVRVNGLHRIEFPDAKGRPHHALLEIR